MSWGQNTSAAAAESAATEHERCTFCGSLDFIEKFTTSDRLYATTTKGFAIRQCVKCGLMRLSPQPGADEFADYYPPNYWFDPQRDATSRLEEMYRRLVLRDHVWFVERALLHSGVSGPVLDVGCGGGLLIGMLRERGVYAIGLDLSQDAARLARQRHSVDAVAGNLPTSPFAPQSFAAVTMFHVLEHVREPLIYLCEAGRLLKPHGRLIVQVPNAASWQFAVLGRAWNGVDAPRHLHLFRDCDVERMLDSMGFEIVRRKYFSLRDNPAGLATSLAPSLDPMARAIRKGKEGSAERLLKDALYFSMVFASLPFTLSEAAFRAGSTVMIEAQQRT